MVQVFGESHGTKPRPRLRMTPAKKINHLLGDTGFSGKLAGSMRVNFSPF